MSSVPDPYRDWDAAYVLGSLSPSERHEYEQHLTTCTACSTDVAELAGISGVLRAVPADRAVGLLASEPDSTAPDVTAPELAPVPPTLLPRFVEATRRQQSRARARTAVWVAGGLAATAAAVLVIALAVGLIGSPSADAHHLTMAQTAPGPITAEATFSEQPWGTTIELECSYAETFDGRPMDETLGYALFVIDRSGGETEQATWQAAPGTTVTPTATTRLSINEIARIEIRWIGTGRVVLEATPEL